MKRFRSIEQLDTAILYALELTSSISVLLQCEQQMGKEVESGKIVRESAVARDQRQEENESEQETNNYERVKAYLATHLDATMREIAHALVISTSTVNKWCNCIKAAASQDEHRE